MIRALLVLVFLLVGCLADPPDDEDQPDTRTAKRADPRCLPGGLWNDNLGACEYPDTRPPAGPNLSTTVDSLGIHGPRG